MPPISGPKPLPPIRNMIAPMLFVVGLFVFSLYREPPPSVSRFSGEALGTTWSMVTTEKVDTSVERLITKELDTVNQLMSTYLPDSEVSKFNRHDTSPFAISPPTHTVLQASMDIYQKSEGAFDITVGPVVNAWGFGFPPSLVVPTEEELHSLQTYVGTPLLSLQESALIKSDARSKIDLSAIAKGFAVDQVVVALEKHGLHNFVVEVGGELVTRGKKWENSWMVAVEKPEKAQGSTQIVFGLDNLALATSGDYRNYKEVDGKRISHTIDPRNNHPIDNKVASVSVITTNAMEADGWATALQVLGEEKALEKAQAYNLAIYMLIREEDGSFREVSNAAFAQYLPSTTNAQ